MGCGKSTETAPPATAPPAPAAPAPAPPEASNPFPTVPPETSAIQVPSAKYKIIFVLGGPGCGKGTQCEMMVAQLGYLHVSAGDLLREEVSSGSEGGKAIADFIKNGQIVPGKVTIDLLKKWIEKKPVGSTILVDGFPREMRQALDFESGVAAASAVLYFKAKDDTLSTRLLKRGMTSGRSDDNLESIQKRLATFHEQSYPVILYFQAKDKVLELDAEKKKEEIFEALKAGLKSKDV